MMTSTASSTAEIVSEVEFKSRALADSAQDRQGAESSNSSHLWVQCENSYCKKWRKLEKVAFKNGLAEEAWYCNMNPNSNYNDCSIPEEKSRLKRGETYIFSELEIGSLVWAKISGYPKWPGIISSDPNHCDGAHSIPYKDGKDTKYYHIEFLGKPATHAWVLARRVELYNKETQDSSWNAKSKNPTKGLRRKSVHERYEQSIIQADDYVSLSREERLQKCVFQYSIDDWRKTVEEVKPLESGRRKGKRKSKSIDQDMTMAPQQDQSKVKVSRRRSSFDLSSHDDIDRMFTPPSTSFQSLYVNVNGRFYPVVSRTDNIPLRKHKGGKSQTDAFKFPCTSPEQSSSVSFSLQCHAAESKKSEQKSSAKKKSKERNPVNKNITSTYLVSGMDKENDIPELEFSNEKQLEEPLREVCDQVMFWKKYSQFCQDTNIPEEDTRVKWRKKDVDLYDFYRRVQVAGGYNRAISHWKCWRNICLAVTGETTEAPYNFYQLRKSYRQVLLNFEIFFKTGVIPVPKKRKKKESSNKKKGHSLGNVSDPIVPGDDHMKATAVAHSSNNVLRPVSSNVLSSPTIPFDKSSSSEQHDCILDQVVPGDNLPCLDEFQPQPDVILKGAHPFVPLGLVGFDDSTLPSSNPRSPSGQELLVSPRCSSISEGGLDLALEEVDELVQQLHYLSESACSSNLFSDDDTDPGNDSSLSSASTFTSYQPVKEDELNDVLGELVDLENTINDIAGDVLSSSTDFFR